ncbi:DUF1549 domain-containing protein [Blastopirellula sp. J2-11]|uniref:DUF1549 domain-containing protein n=1 Tax=Blastopirellula sp. J2-11 TaxID=2943192 RepID=UPI0021C5A379|nr:DUF1549 domain-containing protein [Blastopirellula sp. J2-11]UUO04596.1 DUF1549 domain-containing protein [Blastopirellula sp. J2-11]
MCASSRFLTVFQSLGYVLFLATTVFGSPNAGNDFFEAKIRPVLVQHCYACHNSFGKAKGGLALDYKDALLAGGDSGDVVIAGDPEESILLQALRHENGYEMPAQAPPLSKAVIQDFEHWIKIGLPDPRVEKPKSPNLEGAPAWDEVRDSRKQWWAFQPLQQATIPDVDDPAWDKSPLDRFVYARMRQAGLKPQAVASPETLVRRVHLILTGQLPDPEVARRFVEEPSDAAYEALVDQLLMSKAFGECWARHWQDWYRYAESHGSEEDPKIPYVRQYRDYLVRAINADVGYDQLLMEHLAGDLMKTPRINEALSLNESAIGAAHLRMVPHGYGVTDAYGEQITFTDNQIDVVSKAMLGLTVSCARCHNHKFDPISQKDFYRFYGIFASGRPSNIVIDSPARLSMNREEILEVKAELRKRIADHWLTQLSGLAAWLQKFSSERKEPPHYSDPIGVWMLLKDESPKNISRKVNEYAADLAKMKKARAESIANASLYLDLKDPANQSRWKVTGNSSATAISPAGSFAMQPEGNAALLAIYPGGVYSHLVSNKHAAVFNTENIQIDGKHAYVRAVGDGAQARTPIRAYPLTRGGGLHRSNRLDRRSLDWMKLSAKWEYWHGEQCHFELSTGKDMLPYPSDADRSWFGVTEIYAGDSPPLLVGASLLALVKDLEVLKSTEAISAAYEATLRDAVNAWRRGDCTDVQAEFLNEFLQLGFFDNQLDQLPAKIQKQVSLYRKLEQAIPAPTRAPGVIEVKPVDQPLLVRGDHRNETAPVPQGFLEVFDGRTYDGSTSGRLELAKDVVSDNNTLKSRVLVNRLWAYVFGRGLVASTDNFGRLGSEPTHPALLDHLAIDFEQNAWSLKHTIRELVTSRAFRSAGQADEPTIQQDPQNIYLSYFLPRRLDAEAIYDSVGQFANQTERAIYLPVIRNEQDPFLAVFNMPIPTTTNSARTNTNVPAQALAMMNGQVVKEAAQQWADRIDRQHPALNDEEKIQKMFLEAYVRPPSSAEIEILTTHYREAQAADSQIRNLAAEMQVIQQSVRKTQAEIDQLIMKVRKEEESDRAQATAANRGENLAQLPLAEWRFDGDATDQRGDLDGVLKGDAKIEGGALILNGGYMETPPLKKPLKAKTLEALVSLGEPSQSGGGVISVQTLDGNYFDSIVFGEIQPRCWIAGSDHHQRTIPLAGAPEETLGRPLLLTIVYDEDGTITVYRNTELYGKSYRKGPAFTFESGGSEVLLGMRHGVAPSPGRMFRGRIHEARLYDRALSAQEIAESKLAWSTLAEIPIGAPEQKERFAVLQDELQTLALAKARVHIELQKWNEKLRSHGTYGIAHAMLNSKEFLYVY